MADSKQNPKAASTPRSTPTLPQHRRKPLPCGATTCLHCHAQCGAVMSSYILDGLETPPEESAE